MTQIPTILHAVPRVTPENAPAAEANTEDATGSGTFDAALALAVGQLATPVVRPLEAVLIATVAAPVPVLGEALVPAPAKAAEADVENSELARPASGGRTLLHSVAPNPVNPSGLSPVLSSKPQAVEADLDPPVPVDTEAVKVAVSRVPVLEASGEEADSVMRKLEVRAGRIAAPETKAPVSDVARAEQPVALPNASDTLGDLEATVRPRAAALPARVAEAPTRDAAITPAPQTAETVRTLRAGAPVGATDELAETAVRPHALRPNETPLHRTEAAAPESRPVVDRGESAASLGARVVSLAIGGDMAASGAAHATTRRATRGAAIAAAVTEGVKQAAAPHSPTPAARPPVARDNVLREAPAEAPARTAARRPDSEPVANAVVREQPAESAPIATVATRVAPSTDAPNSGAAVKAAAAPAEPLVAPRSGDRVTLSLEGENGVEGRVRIALRGERVHATLVSHDGTTLENWNAGLDQLRRSLGDRGFAEPRVAIQHAVKAEVHDTSASEYREHRSPREGQKESHSGGNSREAHEERHTRRPPQKQSEKEST